MGNIISTTYEEVDISVVKIKGGKLHINNKQKDKQFKYIWEENDEFLVSYDGETWYHTVKDFTPRMDC